jgi:glycosyltransferase involved in cell wall biosynthesis
MGVLHITSGKSMRGAENQVLLQILGLKSITADLEDFRQAGVFAENSEISKKVEEHCSVLTGSLSMLNLLLAIRVLIKFPRSKFKIIHANCSKSLSFALLVKFLRGGQIVMSRRTVYTIKSTWKYRFVDAVIACSKAIEKKLIEVGIPEKKIHLIYDSVLDAGPSKMPIANTETKSKIVLCGAALEKEKGLFVLLEAWAIVKKRQSIPSRLLIAGKGSLKANIDEYIKDKKIKDVECLGWVENIEDLITCSTVCVLASESEGLGSFLCEAAYIGKPLCGSDVGGIPEVIANGVNGYLHKFGDSNKLAENLIKIFSDNGLAEKFSRESREKAQKMFSLKLNSNKLKTVYSSL